MANRFIVNSIRSKERMQQIIEEEFQNGRYVVFEWHYGELATINQKKLIHVWFAEWAAFILHKNVEDVSVEEAAAIKRKVKSAYYHETAAEWMASIIRELTPPYRLATEYTSIAKWTPAQCFSVMEWMQATAANAGLVLESKGEFAEMKKSQNK